MKAVATTNFISVVLNKLNKTEKQQQQENVERFAEDAAIDCSEQISALTADIHRANNAVSRAEKAVVRAEEELKESKYTVAKDFTSWVDGINAAAHKVNALKLDLDGTRRQVAVLTEQKTQFEGLLEILK
jgi:chromosome segregation ATPase